MSPKRVTKRRSFAVNPAWAIPILAIATLGLGVWGWEDKGYRLADALFRTTGLFDTANGFYEAPPPGAKDWRFSIAEWTGFATLSTTFFFTIFALLQARATHAAAVASADSEAALAASVADTMEVAGEAASSSGFGAEYHRVCQSTMSVRTRTFCESSSTAVCRRCASVWPGVSIGCADDEDFGFD